MHKLLNIALFVVSLAVVVSACGPANLVTETPVQAQPVPVVVATAEPVLTTITASLETATLENARPTKTLAQELAVETEVYLPYVVTPGVPSSTPEGLIADHRAVDEFDSIPRSAIDAAAAKKILYYHQSTGGNIESLGLDCLAGLKDPNYVPECAAYSQNPGIYNRANWNWQLWPEPMADAGAKMDQFVSLVGPAQQNYDNIGMKFCYVDSWNQDFGPYRAKMEALESQYPNKIFIWATSAIYGSPTACQGSGQSNCEKLQAFNDELRAYARAYNKPLYDIAAIESNGGACKIGNFELLCPEYSDGMGGGGGHPDIDGSIRLAKGFWWLMAKLYGSD